MRVVHFIPLLLIILISFEVSCGAESTSTTSEELLTESKETPEIVNESTPETADSNTNESTPISVDDSETEESSSVQDEDAEKNEPIVEKEKEVENDEGGGKEDSSSSTPKEETSNSKENVSAAQTEESVQINTSPFVDLLGKTLLSLEMIDDTNARLVSQETSDALKGKDVVGVYFSADWCGPCRQFTPELVSFYKKMNARRGKKDKFQIVWVSRCRDFDSFGQFFTKMNWLALPFEEAAGRRGQMLSDKYKVKGIPTLVLLDDMGNVITTEGRNKIPVDKAGIGFPWRNPLVQLYVTLLPKSLRLMIKSQIGGLTTKIFGGMKEKVVGGVKGFWGKMKKTATA